MYSFFIVMSRGLHASAVLPDCKELLTMNSFSGSALTPQEESYLRLIEVSLKNKFITIDTLTAHIQNLKSGVLKNPFSSMGLSSETLPYKSAFAKLIKQIKNQSLTHLISELEKMLKLSD